MTTRSNRRAPFGPLAVSSFFSPGGARPSGRTVLPAPPSEVRREAQAQPPQGPATPRGDNTAPRTDNAAAVPPPGPDYGRLYREAAARTRELLARGNGRAALPLWEGFGESPYAAEAAFNRGVLLQLSGDSQAVRVAEAAGYPVVVKAQVQVGGRGKAGGIKLANNAGR